MNQYLGKLVTVADKANTFTMIGDQEREQTRELDERIRKIEGDIGLADRTLAAVHGPGFQDFIEAVRRKRDLTRRDMEGCYDDDSHMRILQGRTQALTSMISILTDTETVKRNLSAELARLKEFRSQTVRPDGKVKPVTIGGLK
jgi:hypothetical protein